MASFHSTSNCKRVFSWPSLRCRTLGIAGQTYPTKNPKARFQDDLLERPCRCREECYATYRLSSIHGNAPMTKGFWKPTILPRSPVHFAIVEKRVPSLQPEGLLAEALCTGPLALKILFASRTNTKLQWKTGSFPESLPTLSCQLPGSASVAMQHVWRLQRKPNQVGREGEHLEVRFGRGKMFDLPTAWGLCF